MKIFKEKVVDYAGESSNTLFRELAVWEQCLKPIQDEYFKDSGEMN